MNKIKKVVIPVAGKGTRFLPITKTISKTLLPIVDSYTRNSCGVPSMKLLQNAPSILMLSSGSWRRPATRSSMGAAVRSLFLFRGRSGRPGCGHPPSGTVTIPRTSRPSSPGSARSRNSLFLCLRPLAVSI